MTTRKDSRKLSSSQPTLSCVNCGDNLGDKGVGLFQSFINNAPARILVEEAIQEIYRLNDQPNFKFQDECVLCVHCCLLFSQMFGLFRLFEARQSPEGLLASCCSGFRNPATAGNENVIEVDVTEDYDDDDDEAVDPFSCLTVESVEDDNFESSEEMEGVEESEDPNAEAFDHNTAEKDDQLVASKICPDGKELIFKCADCSKAFKQAVQLQTHRVSAHNSKEAYKCAVCKNVYPNETIFRRHLFEHWRVAKNKFNITCSKCDRKFPNRSALTKHKSLMHSFEPKKKLKKKLKKILKPKKPESLRCMICDENFDSTILLRKHRLVAHINTRRSASRDQAELQRGLDIKADVETGQDKVHRDEEVDVQESTDPDFDPRADDSSSESGSEDEGNASESQPQQRVTFECTDCNLTYDMAARYGRHRKEKHGDLDRPFKCHLCPLAYKAPGVLKNHVLYKHSNLNLPVCKDCNRTFTSHRRYCYHMQDQHKIAVVTTSGRRNMPATYDKVMFMCTECNILDFPSEDAYLEHIQNIHKREAFKCPQCPKFYRDQGNLNKHLETHEKNPFACDVCDATFLYAWDLKRHVTYEHVEQPTMDPDDDSPSSQDNNDVEDIQIKQDPNTGLFSCPLCPSIEFKTRRNCRFHLTSVHPELMTFECEICHKKYKNMNSLKLHRKRIHQTVKCEYCDDYVSNLQNVQSHITRFHSSKLKETKKQLDSATEPMMEEEEEAAKEPGSFKCADCDQNFETNSLLVSHRAKDHPDSEKLKCPHCLKVSPNAKALRAHILSHDEGEDWPCGECPLRFTVRAYRNRHLEEAHAIVKAKDDMLPLPHASTLKHLSGEFSKTEKSTPKKIQRFKCPECDEEFKLPFNLGNHRVIVHGVNQSERFKCYHCQKILPSVNYYYEHTKRHGEKRNLCSECGKCFSTTGDLTVHFGLMHDEAAGAKLRAKYKRSRDKKKQQQVKEST